VGYPIENLFGCPTAGAGGTDLESCMGGNNGPGFGWDDVGTMKFGLSWQASPTLTLRAGYSKADQPITANQVLLNIIAPAVIEQHYTVGLTRQLGNNREFSAMLMVAPSNRVSGASTFDPTQTIELEMDQLEVEFAYRF
jgi:long-chain fatty acid transport protein